LKLKRQNVLDRAYFQVDQPQHVAVDNPTGDRLHRADSTITRLASCPVASLVAEAQRVKLALPEV
jgi:hypothetical protein